jgi:hypothetical protein
MDVSPYRHSDSIRIEAPAAEVYAIVSDVTRMGELSPVCTSGTWDDPSQAGKVGAWFTGHNAVDTFTWDTRCEVVSAVPDRDFTFVNHGPEGLAELVRWGFAFEDHGGETTVTESWQVLPAYPDFVTKDNPDADVVARLDGMAAMARDGIHDTLANLRRIAEA